MFGGCPFCFVPGGGTSLGTLFMDCQFDVSELHSPTCERYKSLATTAMRAASEEVDSNTTDSGVGDSTHTHAETKSSGESDGDASDSDVGSDSRRVDDTTATATSLSPPPTASFAHEAGADAFMTGCVFLDLNSRSEAAASSLGWLHNVDGNHEDANQGE